MLGGVASSQWLVVLGVASLSSRNGDALHIDIYKEFARCIQRLRYSLRHGAVYFRRWLVIGIIVGVISGVAALAFYYMLDLFTDLFFGLFLHTSVPKPRGEGGTTHFVPGDRYWLLPLVTALGGAVSGLIVYRFAPEAEGHGTDAAIHAFHFGEGRIRRRVILVKMVSSAITIGSGGSAGREGPTAQIAAGVGSMIADLLKLSTRDRRIVLATGIGAGIGAIFKAPIGGAILAAEILYRRDIEAEVLYPALIASTVSYVIFGSVTGFTPIFGYHRLEFDPLYLPFFAVLGVVCGLAAILYVEVFYGIHTLFSRAKLCRYLKPAVGGLVTGLVGLAFPEVLSTSYGWIQILLDNELDEIHTYGVQIALALILIAILKMIATGFSIGSGGSGGVFAPGLTIGAFIGAALGIFFKNLFPETIHDIRPFIIVGMLSLFGAAGKVPLAVTLMIAEMTGSYTLLPGMIVAVTIAYIISGEHTIYRSQVATRLESPAHREALTLNTRINTSTCSS